MPEPADGFRRDAGNDRRDACATQKKVLAKIHFVIQSLLMQPNWAAENLQVIRTLMERSALYRRALAPIATFLGVVGIAAAVAGWKLNIETTRGFAIYWMAVSLGGLVGAFLLIRRQALKSGEKFWSPPTRRIAQAIFPALFVGMVFGVIVAVEFKTENDAISASLAVMWSLLFGLALNSAGFFMQRGIRLFGWAFLLAALGFVALFTFVDLSEWEFSTHLFMGAVFGGGHLTYGAYLYFTEKGKNAA